jgi:4-hydroxy-2-oxoglutarate aldolase
MMAPTSAQDLDVPASTPALSGVENRLEAGIYVPTVAFFKDDEEVDIETTRKHALRLASSGIKGIGQDIGIHRTKYVLTLYSHTRE